jgi:uncharacterized membrane protein
MEQRPWIERRRWVDPRWLDRRIEVIIGNLLRTGVLLSACVVLVGAGVYLKRHAFEPAEYHVFSGEPSDFRTVSGILHSVAQGRGRGLIQLGLLLLIATPVARVFFSLGGFAIEGDRMYVVFTAIVLAILLYSIFGSGLGT